MHKVMFVDVESTGDGSDINHSLLEVAFEYWVFYADGRARQIDTFYIKIAPNDMFVYQRLFGRHGQTNHAGLKKAQRFRDLELPTEKEAFDQLSYWLDTHIRGTDKTDKASLYAFSSEHDMTLLRNFFERNNSNFLHSYFYKTDICIRRLAADYVGMNRHLLAGERLQDFCRYFKIPIEEDNLHTAWYDVELSRQLYFIVWILIKERLNSLNLVATLKVDKDEIN